MTLAAAAPVAAAPVAAAASVARGPAISEDGMLTGVSTVSASDVFAVGENPAVALRWNGKGWSGMALPPKTGNYDLQSVSAVSGTDAWAVGAGLTGKVGVGPVALHWDGTRWTRVPTPAPGTHPTDDELSGVSADSAQDAWAVGYYGPLGSGTSNALVLHWNGTGWTRVPSHAPALSQLFAVDALSPTDVWAVGQYLKNGSEYKTLVLHWNGTAWSQVASPTVGYLYALEAVTAVSPTDIWAVGSYATGTVGVYKTLVLHWNGKTWAQVPSPSPAGTARYSYSYLFGISADSASDAWAVGSYGNSGQRNDQKQMILHWNGRAWSRVTIPAAAGVAGLAGVAALSPTNAWAVGAHTHTHTLIMHWNGKSWAFS